MVRYGKKLGKRMTSLLMVLSVMMTVFVSVEPIKVHAATTYTGQVNASSIKLDDILTANAAIVNDSIAYDTIRISVDSNNFWTDLQKGSSLSVSTILSRLNKSNLYTIRCTEFSSKEWKFKTVAPPKATVSDAPTAASLTYNGNNQKLLATNGTATNGTMYYCVTTTASAPADSEFTITDGNSLTKKEAGTYYVWYMAKGNTGYENSSKAYFSVEIAKATPTSPTTPTLSNSVSYGTALSQISLSNDNSWIWENGTITPNAGTTAYTVIYNKTLDTANYDWSTVEGYDSTSSKIKRTVSVTVTPVEKTDETFTVPTNLSKAYDAAKTLKALIPFSDNN